MHVMTGKSRKNSRDFIVLTCSCQHGLKKRFPSLPSVVENAPAAEEKVILCMYTLIYLKNKVNSRTFVIEKLFL